MGFFISYHPLNQFKEFFSVYNIIDYQTMTKAQNLHNITKKHNLKIDKIEN
mgnify:CR=1 FL=1